MEQKINSQSIMQTTEMSDPELDSIASFDKAQESATQIIQSKLARKAAKANVMQKMKEITELMKDTGNLGRIQNASLEFEECLDEFASAHCVYHKCLTDEDDVQESEAYYGVEIRKTAAFKIRINKWIDNAKICKRDGIESSEIRPSDSISNVGTGIGSKTSRKSSAVYHSRSNVGSLATNASSAVSAKVAATARKAALEEQARRLQRRQQLQQQELFIQQQKEELELETKLAQAAAEERAYSEVEAPVLSESYSQHNNALRARSIDAEPVTNNEEGVKPPDQVSLNQSSDNRKIGSSSLNPHANEWVTVRQNPANVNRITSNYGSLVAGNDQGVIKERSCTPVQSPKTPDAKLIEILNVQQQQTLAMTLPSPTVPIFSGNPIDYHNFIQAFEQLIQTTTQSVSSRLYYLVQYTFGDVQDLVRSC